MISAEIPSQKYLITGQRQCVQETVCTLERPANWISLILKIKKLFVFEYKKVKHVLLSKYLERIWVYLLVFWRRAFHYITSMYYLTVRYVFREWKVGWHLEACCSQLHWNSHVKTRNINKYHIHPGISSLYKSLPRVSCTPSSSLRRSRCGLWDKPQKTSNLWPIGALSRNTTGSLTGHSSISMQLWIM